MSDYHIKIGTRASKLAKWQAKYVARLLEAGGFNTTLIPIQTQGDKVSNMPISEIGTQGVFTKELELALQNQQVDLAVHSAKDLSSLLPDDLSLLAYCKREPPLDVIVAEKEINLNASKLVLGTSSVRRTAFFRRYHPHIQIENIRGNLQTRIEKLKLGNIDGIILAYAGVKRMQYDKLIKHSLDTEKFVPSVGQGAIAIEVHKKMSQTKAKKIRAITNHALTEKLILCERTFLATLGGGCSIPVFGHAQINPKGAITLTGGVISMDGKDLVKHTQYGKDTYELGKSLAKKILENGGKKILDDLNPTFSQK